MLHLSSLCTASILSGIAAVIAYKAYTHSPQDKIKKAAEQFLSTNGALLFRLVDLFDLTRSHIISGELFLGGYTPIVKRIDAILDWDESLQQRAVTALRKFNVDWDDVVKTEFSEALSVLVRKAFDPDKAGEAAINSSPHDMDIARALIELVNELSERDCILTANDYEEVE